MKSALEPLPVPLQEDADGVLRVVGSRVTIDVLVEDYRNGASAEELVMDYPTLKLEDVHAVLSYYLRHKDEVDAYVAAQEARSEGVRRDVLKRSLQAGLRERLLARRR